MMAASSSSLVREVTDGFLASPDDNAAFTVDEVNDNDTLRVFIHAGVPPGTAIPIYPGV